MKKHCGMTAHPENGHATATCTSQGQKPYQTIRIMVQKFRIVLMRTTQLSSLQTMSTGANANSTNTNPFYENAITITTCFTCSTPHARTCLPTHFCYVSTNVCPAYTPTLTAANLKLHWKVHCNEFTVELMPSPALPMTRRTTRLCSPARRGSWL
jgi:hypothetical protein